MEWENSSVCRAFALGPATIFKPGPMFLFVDGVSSAESCQSAKYSGEIRFANGQGRRDVYDVSVSYIVLPLQQCP